MVISAEKPRQPPDPIPSAPRQEAAAAAAHSHLHNFSFPILKKWGSQRVLRCLNVNGEGEIIKSPHPLPPPPLRSAADEDSALDHLREKLLVHLREAEGRVKLPLPPPPTPAYPPPPEPAPWNLRARRTPVKHPSVSPPRTAVGSREERGNGHVRTVRLRSEDGERREPRPRFSVTLTREEIDEDIYAVTGARARRRPKKRPRVVQKQLDTLFPGSWLGEITADSYKVPD